MLLIQFLSQFFRYFRSCRQPSIMICPPQIVDAGEVGLESLSDLQNHRRKTWVWLDASFLSKKEPHRRRKICRTIKFPHRRPLSACNLAEIWEKLFRVGITLLLHRFAYLSYCAQELRYIKRYVTCMCKIMSLSFCYMLYRVHLIASLIVCLINIFLYPILFAIRYCTILFTKNIFLKKAYDLARTQCSNIWRSYILTAVSHCHFILSLRERIMDWYTALLLLYFQVFANCASTIASASTDSLALISRGSVAKRRHWMSVSLVTDYTSCNTSYTISLPISLVPGTMKTQPVVRTAAWVTHGGSCLFSMWESACHDRWRRDADFLGIPRWVS